MSAPPHHFRLLYGWVLGLTLSACGTPPPHTFTPTLPPPRIAHNQPTLTPTLTQTLSPTPSASRTPTTSPWPTLPPSPTPATATRTPLWPTVIPATREPDQPPSQPPPTLDDYWEGRAGWQLDVANVGLPIGESETIIGPDGQLWSYLHASYPSAKITDQFRTPVPFPGCVTLWTSADNGRSFSLTQPRCLIQCGQRPCLIQDHVGQQQYPRVAQTSDGSYWMVYENGAAAYVRRSADGLNWSLAEIVPATGQWRANDPCPPGQTIGPHPWVPSDSEYTCLAGGPPGIVIDQDEVYIFVGLGKNPGSLGCFRGAAQSGPAGLHPCTHNPLFVGATEYGAVNALGAAANDYFDFRIISSAEGLRVGDHYYVLYEGIRGPHTTLVGDMQFGLGLARSLTLVIDGPWEKYPNNPLLLDLPGNVGIGHTDLIVLEGVTYLYTSTSAATRGRYVLTWR